MASTRVECKACGTWNTRTDECCSDCGATLKWYKSAAIVVPLVLVTALGGLVSYGALSELIGQPRGSVGLEGLSYFFFAAVALTVVMGLAAGIGAVMMTQKKTRAVGYGVIYGTIGGTVVGILSCGGVLATI